MLDITDLSFSFGAHTVLRDISASMSVDRIYGILGKNGAGKTTFFRNIMGWYRPERGRIRLNGRPIRREDVAFLETANYFYPYMKGREYLELISAEAGARGESLADALSVPLDELVDAYSTGMKKKLAFIGALILERPLLLLDEPFNGVDLESNEVLKRLIQLNRPGRITLMSSHILSTLFDGCDAIFYLVDGRIQTFEKAEFSQLREEVQQGIARKMETYARQIRSEEE